MSQLTAALIGILAGAVVKYVADRYTERGKRQHERESYVRQQGLQHALSFLTSADWLARTTQSVDVLGFSMENAQNSARSGTGSPEVYDKYRQRWEDATKESAEVFRTATAAYLAVSLFLPGAVTAAARTYLDLCMEATGRRDTKADEREAARRATEEAVRAAAGVPAQGAAGILDPNTRTKVWPLKRSPAEG